MVDMGVLLGMVWWLGNVGLFYEIIGVVMLLFNGEL